MQAFGPSALLLQVEQNLVIQGEFNKGMICRRVKRP
jgi:hypothetical protein